MTMKEKDLFKKVLEAKRSIQKSVKSIPRVGIILGTGLGDVRKRIKIQKEISYEKIPHFPRSTVQSHQGRLIFGKYSNVPVVAMEGRFHAYEGYSLEEVTFPVRVMKSLGIRFLLVSNAAGGVNPQFNKGDLMLITDHINFLGNNPLIGPNDERFGVRFPDMSDPYSKRLADLAEGSALKHQIPIKRGVYLCIAGPSLETRAEYRMIRIFGADAVGMSTVPEVIVAIHMQLEVLAISVITDLCFPESLKPLSIEEVIKISNQTGPKLAQVFGDVLEKLSTLRPKK